jgi:hypothetical protein
VDVVIARGQIGRIRVLLEYSPDDRADIGWGLRLSQGRESLVDRFAHHVRQRHPLRAESLRLPQSLLVEPDIDESGTHT